MMLLLIKDVLGNLFSIGFTNRKCAITFLPKKIFVLSPQTFYPSTSVSFNFSYKIRQT